MTDYSKTVIYKIQHLDKDELLYVGHTTNFTKRKNHHKKNSIEKTTPVYKMMRENGGWNCFTMIVIKEFSCASKTEACIEEDKIMREMKASMNNYRAYVSPEEKTEYQKGYKQANKEHISESKKIYRQANIERIDEQKREPIECDCGCIIKRYDLARHKRTKKHLKYIEK
jgi:predicted GIY-YIG superfamily endonuclease